MQAPYSIFIFPLTKRWFFKEIFGIFSHNNTFQVPIEKILLVDDDADDQLFFRDALQEIDPNIKCELASNGHEALQLLASRPYPELIFLDLNMPVMNGFDCLLEIRRKDQLKEVPVIIFTTTNDHHAIKRTYELGANAFLKKPNDFSTILNKLKTLVETDFKGNEKKPVFSLTEFAI